MFYAFPHHIYQEVEYRELKNFCVLPTDVRELRVHNHTFSTSAVLNKAQDGDFVLEQIIKRQKMLCPKGKISSEIWEKVSNAVDTVDEILCNFDHLSVLERNRKRITNVSHEVFQWRCYLRSSCYFERSLLFNNPISIYGDVLSKDMINLSVNATNLRKSYWKQALGGTPMKSIRYKTLKVALNDESEEISPYVYSSDGIKIN